MSDKAVNYIQGYDDGYEDGLRERTDICITEEGNWFYNGKYYYICGHCDAGFFVVPFSPYEFKYCPACGYRIR